MAAVASFGLSAFIPTTGHAAETGLAPCVPPTTLGVVFVVDNSSSMSDTDPTELRGEAVAIALDQLPNGSRAAMTVFASSSRSVFGPTVVDSATREDLKGDAGSAIAASSNTNYEAAFKGAQTELAAMQEADRRAVVFLSDGAPNSSNFTADLPIADSGVPIFTVGFGTSDATVMAKIAARSGGQTFEVATAGEARAVFARIIARLTCDNQVHTENVVLEPGETRSIPFDVAPDDGEFRALAAWSGGGVAVSARRPDGSMMSAGGLRTGEGFVADDSYALLSGTEPSTGRWSLELAAAPGNYADVNVSIDVWKRQLVRANPLPPVGGPPIAPEPAHPRSECERLTDSFRNGKPYSESLGRFSGTKFSHDESLAKLCWSTQGLAGNADLIGDVSLGPTDWCTIATAVVDLGLGTEGIERLLDKKYLKVVAGNTVVGDACNGVDLAKAFSGGDLGDKAQAVCSGATGALSHLSLVKHVPTLKRLSGGKKALLKRFDVVANIGTAGSLGCLGGGKVGEMLSGIIADRFIADYNTDIRYAIQQQGQCLIEGTNLFGQFQAKTGKC